MPPGTPISGTQTIHPNNEDNHIEPPKYSPAREKFINFRRQRIIAARDSRDASRDEYDGMTFPTYYQILKRADDQFVAPRKNAQDTSINLGTIRDKDTSLVEYAMAHDFEPVAQAYDEDNDAYEELADTGEDLVRKSLSLEYWSEAKAKLVYRSMVAFGTAYVEDTYVEQWIIEKSVKHSVGPNGSMAQEWTERMKLEYAGCQAKLYDLRKCYPGDMRKFFMNGPQGQPFFFTVEYESYDKVKQTFQAWPMFKHVPTIVTQTPEVTTGQAYSLSWTLQPISMNYVEIIKGYDPIANEFYLTLNGVDMLPIMERKETINGEEKTFISGFPLTEVSPSGAIPFAKYDMEPMHDFAFSKSTPAKMRVSADVENMLMKLFIIMFKQKAKPTMGNKSGRQFGPEVTDPATVINDIREGDLFPVLDNYTGAVPADFSFFEIVKKELDKNSVERSWQGSSPTQQDETATKTLNDQKAQATLKVAAMFDGIIWGNIQLYWLRTYNIMKNWTKPIDSRVDELNKGIKDIYRTVTLPSESEGGQNVTKKIVFTKDTPKLGEGKKRASLNDSFDVMDKEKAHRKEYGSDVRITHIHPELFSAARMTWSYTCVPVPKSNDPLSYMVFAKQVTDAQTMFGPESLNVKRLKHRFARLTGTDFDTWFLSEQELQNNQAMAAASPQGGGPGGGPGVKPAAKIPGKPTGAGPTIASATSGAPPALNMASMMQ